MLSAKRSWFNTCLVVIFFLSYAAGPFIGMYIASLVPGLWLEKLTLIRLGLILTPFFIWFAVLLIPYIPRNSFRALIILMYPVVFAMLDYLFFSPNSWVVIENILTASFYFTGSVLIGYALIVFVRPLYTSGKSITLWRKAEWLEYGGVAALQLILLVPGLYVLYILMRTLIVQAPNLVAGSILLQSLYFIILLWPLLIQTRDVVYKMRTDTN